jgi:uncharacterized protein YhjY with autotransporter beta-barrel domain
MLAMPGGSALAFESHFVHDPDGEAVFEIRFFGPGDGPLTEDLGKPIESTWSLSAQQKSSILSGISYWAEVIKLAPLGIPGVVNVGADDSPQNAYGMSQPNGGHPVYLTNIQAALQGLDVGELQFGSHAQFVMGILDYDKLDYVPSHVPRPVGPVDVASLAIHELAHGLGIDSAVVPKGSYRRPHFADSLSTWSHHLRDDNGNPARPGQSVSCADCDNPYDGAAFDVRQDKGYFSGQHVDEVLAGAMPGVPVRMLGEGGTLDTDYMSHIELKNSLMSHQSYRNYTTFMEAELALLQDMGYDIDRRNFFGYSVYGNGQTIVNNNGYFRRNASRSGYLPGQYNTATLGLGLHIYGSHNTLHQRADLLTQGAGGAGVRVDGQGNTLVIEPGTRVHADGINGRGILFAYGKDHNLIQRGDVQALGKGGVAVNFDFGNNAIGNPSGYRGSYINEEDGNPEPLLDELDGALVNQFDLTGRVAGSDAAIRISPNALVNRINIMGLAQVQGNIYSSYTERDGDGKLRLTQLTFGLRSDDSGRATGQADAGFAFRYDGDIQGANLALSAKGGTTSLNGDHHIHSMTVEPAATLKGSSRYTVDGSAAFINNGIVAPGNSLGRIDIVGDFQQGPGGQLLMEVDGSGGHDTLAVSGNADLNGQLTLAPLSDWYAPGWSLASSDLLQAGSVTGAFSAVDSKLVSPTVSFQAVPSGTNAFRFQAARAANAYSQYAGDANARQVGLALDGIVSGARSDMHGLYQALDFSPVDGSGVASALQQLSPAAYSAMFASSLNRERHIADLVAARGTPGLSLHADSSWRAFAAPFGGGAWQNQRDSLVAYDATSYGVVVGAEKRSAAHPAWVVGAHGAVSEQSVKVREAHAATGKTTALSLGLHARYAPDTASGFHAFGQGQLGIEAGKMTHRIGIGNYSASNKSDWTGYSGMLAAGAGYRWAFDDTFSAGPIASLNYTTLSRPGVTESGPDASRLKLDSARFNSLRSSVGVSASLNKPLKNERLLKAELQLTWDRELLDKSVVQDASFVGYPGFGFSSRNKVTGRDSLGIGAALAYEAGKDLTLGARLSTNVFQKGNSSVAGNLSATWRF